MGSQNCKVKWYVCLQARPVSGVNRGLPDAGCFSARSSSMCPLSLGLPALVLPQELQASILPVQQGLWRKRGASLQRVSAQIPALTLIGQLGVM